MYCLFYTSVLCETPSLVVPCNDLIELLSNVAFVVQPFRRLQTINH